MAKRTRPHKRSKVKKAAKRKTHSGFFSKYNSRAKIVAAMIVSILFAAASVAYWKVPGKKVAPAPFRSEAMNPARSEAMNKAVVKNVSTLSASELADIPPEAFTHRPPADLGYNAHSGGLPPGALPPGVVLPGMSMMQGGQGYGGYDGVRQQFTGKERDTETGLDYFGARYYSSTQGRFTSADPLIDFKRNISEPQAWNQYQYTINNPLNRTDPDGRQDSAELNMNRDIKDLMEHRITEQQFRDRQNARGVGAAIGAAIVVAAIYGPQAATAILMWAARNPDKVEQIALDLNQASTGSPAPGSPGLTIAAETRLTATEVSTGVRLATQTGVRLTESPFVGEEFVSAAGKTYDAMGVPAAYASKNWGNGATFFKSIVRHLNKSADYTAIDLMGASKSQIKAIEKYVSGLTKEQQAKIIYVR